MLDRFVDAGGTLVDTADTYGRGESERVLAPWSHGAATTSCSRRRCASRPRPPGAGSVARPHPGGLRREPAASRRRRHRPLPGPRARSAVPLKETLEALDGLVRAGKVRAAGASNFPAWLLAWAVAPGPQVVGAVRVAAGAVLARRALRRDRGAAVLPRRRARRCPRAARRRLPHRPLPARHGDAARQPDYDRGRRPRGGPRAAGDRAQLPRRRAEATAAERGASVAQVAIARRWASTGSRRRSTGRAPWRTRCTCSAPRSSTSPPTSALGRGPRAAARPDPSDTLSRSGSTS